MTQGEVAAYINTSTQNISLWERGLRQIKYIYLKKLAVLFECEVAQITGEEISNKKNPVELDSKRLIITQEAVEKTITEKNLKLTREQLAEGIARVYNESLKLELAGEHISINTVARLLINN